MDEINRTSIFRKEGSHDLNNFIRFDLNIKEKIKLYSLLLIPLLPSIIYTIYGALTLISYNKNISNKISFFKDLNLINEDLIKNYKALYIVGIVISFVALSVACFFLAKWIFSGKFKQDMFEIYNDTTIWELVSPEDIQKQKNELKANPNLNKTNDPTAFAKVKNNIDKRHFDFKAYENAKDTIQYCLQWCQKGFNSEIKGINSFALERSALDLEYKDSDVQMMDGVKQDQKIEIHDNNINRTCIYTISFAKLSKLISGIGSLGIKDEDNPLKAFYDKKHYDVVNKKWIEKTDNQNQYLSSNLTLALEKSLRILNSIKPSNELSLVEKIAEKLFYRKCDRSYNEIIPTTVV